MISSIKDSIVSDNLDSRYVSHGFWGRKGGVSSGAYSSLNCSKYVGDDEDCVKKNLDIVTEFIGSSRIITMNQVHGNVCLEVGEKSPDIISGVDAIVTSTKGIALGVLTADCAPILFFDEKELIIGVAHAGWRGAVSGIIESTINKMRLLGSESVNIKVAIGPCIGKNSYEVDDHFKSNFKGTGDCFCLINQKLHFDLVKYCFDILIEMRIMECNIYTSNIDTFKNSEQYFSYRFANKFLNKISGRNISVICLK